MFTQSNGFWFVINDNDGNIEKLINVSLVRSLEKDFEKVFKGEKEDGSLDIEQTDHELTKLTFVDGSIDYIDLPISDIVKTLGLDKG